MSLNAKGSNEVACPPLTGLFLTETAVFLTQSWQDGGGRWTMVVTVQGQALGSSNETGGIRLSQYCTVCLEDFCQDIVGKSDKICCCHTGHGMLSDTALISMWCQDLS